MKINQISFGKIVKVNAPYEITKKISQIANGEDVKNKNLTREVKSVFTDIESGKATTFYYDKISSYIFSGKESQEFNDSYSKACDLKNRAYKIYPDKKIADMHAQAAMDKHRENVMNMIAYSNNIINIDPVVINNKLRSLNLSK